MKPTHDSLQVLCLRILIKQYLIKKILINQFIYKRVRKAIVICIITMDVGKLSKAGVLSNSLFIKMTVNNTDIIYEHCSDVSKDK